MDSLCCFFLSFWFVIRVKNTYHDSFLILGIHPHNPLVTTIITYLHYSISSSNLLPLPHSIIPVCCFICAIHRTLSNSVQKDDETTIIPLLVAHPCGFSFCLSSLRFLCMWFRLALETEFIVYWFAITGMSTYTAFTYRFPAIIQYVLHLSSIIERAASWCITPHRFLFPFPLFADVHRN